MSVVDGRMVGMSEAEAVVVGAVGLTIVVNWGTVVLTNVVDCSEGVS